jgi:transposase
MAWPRPDVRRWRSRRGSKHQAKAQGRPLHPGAAGERQTGQDARPAPLGKFLLRHGERYPGPGRAWTLKHMRWLQAVRSPESCAQATHADYLAVRADHRSPPYAALRARARDPRMLARPVIDRLRCFRGIDTLSAAGVCSEIGDFRRFPSPTLLAGFGIVPSERTSDTKRPQGSITKAGPHARRAAGQGR